MEEADANGNSAWRFAALQQARAQRVRKGYFFGGSPVFLKAACPNRANVQKPRSGKYLGAPEPGL